MLNSGSKTFFLAELMNRRIQIISTWLIEMEARPHHHIMKLWENDKLDLDISPLSSHTSNPPCNVLWQWLLFRNLWQPPCWLLPHCKNRSRCLASASFHSSRFFLVHFVYFPPIMVNPTDCDWKLTLNTTLLSQRQHSDLAGKITGMLLEIDNSELLHMLEDPASLQAKVAICSVEAPLHLVVFR